MRKKPFLVIAILFGIVFGVTVASCQNTSTLSGVVSDGGGTALISAHWQANLIGTQGLTPTYMDGSPVTTVVSGSLDAAGNISGSLGINSKILPTGTSWQFTVCPVASIALMTSTLPGTCFQVSSSATITTTTYNAGAFLSANIPALTVSSQPGAFGYNTSEVTPSAKYPFPTQPIPGQLFYDVATDSYKFWSPISSSWENISGGSGGSPGGTTGAFQYNSGTGFGGLNITGLPWGNNSTAPTLATPAQVGSAIVNTTNLTVQAYGVSTPWNSFVTRTIAIGSGAGSTLGSGATAGLSDNVMIGVDAGKHSQFSQDNVFVGDQAGFLFNGPSVLDPANGNDTCIGEASCYGDATMQEVIAVGQKAYLDGNGATGFSGGASSDVFVGVHIDDWDGGTSNVLVGNNISRNANHAVTGNGNTFLGANILNASTCPQASPVTVASNTFVGSSAGQCAFGASSDTVIGSGAYAANGSGTFNFVGGTNAAPAVTTGSYNVLIGGKDANSVAVANSLTTALGNTIVGAAAGSLNVANNYLTAFGYDAAKNANAEVVALGPFTCLNATATNVCIGIYAGQGITSGANNIIVGMNNSAGAGPVGAFSNNVEIGSIVGLGDNSSNNSYFGTNAGRRNVSSLGTNEAYGYQEFEGTTGAIGTEQFNAFYGDNSNCNGCTHAVSLGHAANIGAVDGAAQIGTGTNNTANTAQYQSWNFLDSSGNVNAKLLIGSHGASAIPSATTIAPSAYITHISGTAAISTITPPTVTTNGGVFSGCIHLIPDGAFATVTGGNIATATTAVVGRELEECYDGTSWYPSY